MWLGGHKEVSAGHRMERTPYMTVSRAAQSAAPSGRLEQLAAPRDRTDPFEVRHSVWGQFCHVTSAALKARASERLEGLAEPRKPHKVRAMWP